jgi:hypothetical protein
VESIKVIVDNTVTFGFLAPDSEVVVIFDKWIWLARVEKTDSDLYQVTMPMSQLGIKRNDLSIEEQAQRVIKYLMKTSLYSYIVQRHMYMFDADWNFDINV